MKLHKYCKIYVMLAAILFVGGSHPSALRSAGPAGHEGTHQWLAHKSGKSLSSNTEKSIGALKSEGSYDSLMAALEKSRYRLSSEERMARPGVPGGYSASNYAQRLRADFTGTGLQVVPHGAGEPPWRWGLRLTGYGYGDNLEALPAGQVSVSENRIEYRYPRDLASGSETGLTEWYVNRAQGIEQGFTLLAPPAERKRGAPLRLALGVSGDLQGRMVEEGKAIEFLRADGATALRYRDLHAYDATGRELPARLALKGERLYLVVDDRVAVYPVTIDPLIFSKTRLTASDGAEEAEFGFSVSVDGDTVVVGARFDTVGGILGAGSAYVFVRSGTSWSQQAKLTAGDGAPHTAFGFSVSVDGDTTVVGAPSDDTAAGIDAGSAYVFVRSGTSWSQQAKLTASDGAPHNAFGLSVSVDGDTTVVGAPWYAGDDVKAGSAYVFVRSGTSWSQQAKLTASDGAESDRFGFAVSVDGNIIVVGAPQTGSVYVYKRIGIIYSEEAKLLPIRSMEPLSGFGISVAATPFHVVVGAPVETTAAGNLAGSAYVFVRLLPYIMAPIDDVADLYRQAVLNAGQANALISKLKAARESLDRNDAQAAINHLRAFINQVNAYINARILSPAQGRTLIDQANVLIDLLAG
jgi:FG-GAP repeat/FIMAH domain